jgi:hypothetical protein
MRSVVFDFAQNNGLKTLQLNQKNKNYRSQSTDCKWLKSHFEHVTNINIGLVENITS